ncbi:hypothetical protein Agabi119p4_5692 [Agaricus bisporus var. burnettii]|uniref:FAD/NAD(P)-binding domain-containing protein n=1 Tax=Agaricus bisporus var. burnettii TaxID=192524 RepID=A0A8H7F2D8_AGABI|nr:hypothetical protein Agabi119p4_5692 [Agaricus bisporus var. burnettii]
MTTSAAHPSEAPLPTLNKLGISSLPEDIDARKVASEWFASFADKVTSNDPEGITNLLVRSSFDSGRPETADQVSVYWRDLLALTWNFRSFEGTTPIREFLTDRLPSAKIANLKLKTSDDAEGLAPVFARPMPDLAWITGFFTFETDVGFCSGIFRLVPTLDEQQRVQWKAHCIFTNLEELRGFPEKVGNLRDPTPYSGGWEKLREKEKLFEDAEPTVLIVGAGQSGLTAAARLKLLGISSVLIEKNERVGDNWRNRYDVLCLHDPVWYDHMPYIPFPENWPIYSPAKKLANWLEFYADSMELNVWTSTTVSHIEREQSTGLFKVKVQHKNKGSERIFTVKHVVLAPGFSGGSWYTPTYPGMDKFKGQIIHSSEYKKAEDYLGKKVILVGSCTSAHDIGMDLYDNGIDVTMYQRSSTHVITAQSVVNVFFKGLFDETGPPITVADKVAASFPNLLNVGIHHRGTLAAEKAEKEMLDNLRRVGFNLNRGYKDAGVLLTAFTRAGGYYLDVGGSQYVIDGKIKLKSKTAMEGFTETGINFADGSQLEADVVVFCTGLGSTRDVIKTFLDPKTFQNMNEIWGYNNEMEFNGIYGDTGVPNLWYMMGSLGLCRFYSKRLALQIKAIEEGVFGERYKSKV